MKLLKNYFLVLKQFFVFSDIVYSKERWHQRQNLTQQEQLETYNVILYKYIIKIRKLELEPNSSFLK